MVSRQQLSSIRAKTLRNKTAFARNRTRYLLALRSARRNRTISSREFKEKTREVELYARGLNVQATQRLETALKKEFAGEIKPGTVQLSTTQVEQVKAGTLQGYESPLLQAEKEPIKETFEPTQEEIIRSSILYTGNRPIRQREGETYEQAVKRSRGEAIVKRVRIKRTLPSSTALISVNPRQKINISIKKKPVRDQTMSLDKGYEERIRKLVKREKKLDKLRTTLFTQIPVFSNVKTGKTTRLNLLSTPEQERLSFYKAGIFQTPVPKYQTTIGAYKYAGRRILGLGPDAFQLGGRVTFFGESLFRKEGRQELKAAIGRVPKALAQAYDPRKVSGILNIGLTAFSIGKLGKARAIKREPVKFQTEGLSTKRFTGRKVISDITKGRVEALLGSKKKLVAKVTARQNFFRTNGKQYLGKGAAKIKLPGKEIKLDIRSLTKLTKTGAKSITVSKILDTKDYFTTRTQTLGITRKPFQTFQELSTTRLNQQPFTVSTGKTSEVFRRPILTESDKLLGIEQVLRTGRISIGSKTFGQNYQFSYTIPKSPFKTNIPFPPTPSTTIVSGLGKKVSIPKLQKIPTLQANVLSAAQKSLSTAIQTVKRTESAKAAQQSIVGAVSVQTLKKTESAKAVQQSISGTESDPTKLAKKPLITTKTTIRVRPIREYAFERSTPVFKQVVKPVVIPTPKPTPTPQPVQPQPIQKQDTETIAVTQVVSSIKTQPVISPITPITITPLFPRIGLLEFPDIPLSKGRKRKKDAFGFKFRQYKSFTPSLTAEVFDIKVPKFKTQRLFSGLEFRPKVI